MASVTTSPPTAKQGVIVPILGVPLTAHRKWYSELISLGYDEIWTGEGTAHDAVTPLALAAAWAPSLSLGTAVLPAFSRGPALLAQTVAALCESTERDVTVGLGCSSRYLVESWNSIKYERPMQRLQDVVRFLRLALTGEKVTQQFETFRVDGFRLGGAAPTSMPRILVAGLRPKMLELAGSESDGAILNWFSPDDVALARQHVGPEKDIVVSIKVIASSDRKVVRDIATRLINAYFHVPVYRASQEWLGRGEALEPMWSAWEDGDRRRATRAIPDSVIDELFVWGGPEQLRAGIKRYEAAGVTSCLSMFFGDLDQIRLGMRTLAPNDRAPQISDVLP